VSLYSIQNAPAAGKPKSKPQISPLRYAPVEMTNLFQEDALSTQWKKGCDVRNKFVISTGA